MDGWLIEEEGLLKGCASMAIKSIVVRQITDAMKEQHPNNTELARRMQTSRAAIIRLLDPKNEAVTRTTLSKVAHALGRELHIQLI